MSELAISFRGVGKDFLYWGDRRDLKTSLISIVKGQFFSQKKESIQVLDDITFEIRKGEAVAILGRNGSGKSTLLKILSKIYRPSRGEIYAHGRIIPLLELGAGFAVELSGYDNIFLNAAFLGCSRAEAREKIDSIIEFSELGHLINMPVKNYSSGMIVRLGFSIAVHLSADILIFDEVFAVGDVWFQQKCFDRIHTVHGRGATIILVTHDLSQISKFCSRAIVLKQKNLIFDGPVDEAREIFLTT